MTKLIRVENADNADYKVKVQVYDKGLDGEPDKLVEEKILLNPTDLRDFYITGSRYLIVSEV